MAGPEIRFGHSQNDPKNQFADAISDSENLGGSLVLGSGGLCPGSGSSLIFCSLCGLLTLQAILKIYVSLCEFYLKAADLKFLPFYPAGKVLWGRGCLVDPGLPFLWVAIVGWCEIGFGCWMPGMVFGRLVWSVGVMAVVVGIGGL